MEVLQNDKETKQKYMKEQTSKSHIKSMYELWGAP